MKDIAIEIRPPLSDVRLNALFSAAWPGHEPRAFGPMLGRSIAWCAVTRQGELVGFVNVAWDGGRHAFLLDPTVHPAHRRRGIGLTLIRAAAEQAAAAGIEWLHVDYAPELAPFYAVAGFRPTAAGLMRLFHHP